MKTGLLARPRLHRRVRTFVRDLPLWLVLLALVLVVMSAALSVYALDRDSGHDLAGVLRAMAVDVARLRWQYVAIVVALACAHYLAATFAARAAAGVPLALGETLLVQLTASAANRLTPAGLGGAAVNARFFSHRGLSVPSAVGAILILDVFGAVADILALGLFTAVGRVLGLGGAPAEMRLLSSRVSGLLAPLRSWWTLAAVGVVLVVVVFLRRRLSRRARDFLHRLWETVRSVRHRPRDVATILLASGSTTLLLAFAFVASIAMVPGLQPHTAIGGLVVGFMMGSAASNAVPTPAGIGSTETALVLLLVSFGLPAVRAVETVVIYRIITFWLPALAGVFASRHLRRTGAL